MYKITIKEFFASKEKIVIHCNTEEKAVRLIRTFHLLGKKWANGLEYNKVLNYSYYYQLTCYSNDGQYANYSYYLDENIKIYEFEEVDISLNIEDCKELIRKIDEMIAPLFYYLRQLQDYINSINKEVK